MGIFIIIPIAVAIILVLSAAYVKAPPNRAAVITGLRKKPRVLLGKAGFKIPFFERVDWMEVGQIDIDIETEDYIPTQDFINIRVDAIAQVSGSVLIAGKKYKFMYQKNKIYQENIRNCQKKEQNSGSSAKKLTVRKKKRNYKTRYMNWIERSISIGNLAISRI